MTGRTKVLRCRDLGHPEDHVICGGDEQELLRNAADHARAVHGKTQFSPEEMQKVRSLIRDEGKCPEIR